MIFGKSELLVVFEKCLYNVEEVFEEEFKDVISKCILLKEYYSEILSLYIIFCNKDNIIFDLWW